MFRTLPVFLQSLVEDHCSFPVRNRRKVGRPIGGPVGMFLLIAALVLTYTGIFVLCFLFEWVTGIRGRYLFL